MKRFFLLFIFIYIFIPITVFAYSDYLIASGKNIGIELKSNNLIIVGAYDIDNYNPLRDTSLNLGDKIIKVGDKEVTGAANLQKILDKYATSTVSLVYERDNLLNTINISLFKDDDSYKSGLYVRDTIRGVATLTYIDPFDKSFGALGHEIVEKSTKSKFDADDGTIFNSYVTGVSKSYDGVPGEKNAISNSKIIYGIVNKNTTSGIFGTYTDTISPSLKHYKVAEPSDIKLGNAKMLTVIDGDKVSEFDINILKINENAHNKNILFEVTSQELLAKTGGIVQGMSGSPIIQGDYIVGAVNYVVVDKTNRGYGIFITTMLKENENN